jgi:hypothetical protein
MLIRVDQDHNVHLEAPEDSKHFSIQSERLKTDGDAFCVATKVAVELEDDDRMWVYQAWQWRAPTVQMKHLGR